MVRNWDPERDGKCPNCQQTENSYHLNLCDNRERTLLLYRMVNNFAKWLSSNYAHPDIAYWIPKYIKLRGIKNLGNFPMLPIAMQPIAASQDLVPWTCFMEGKISWEILLIQESVLASSPSPLSIEYWTKHFITHSLQISHAQWVFRNMSLHNHTIGYVH